MATAAVEQTLQRKVGPKHSLGTPVGVVSLWPCIVSEGGKTFSDMSNTLTSFAPTSHLKKGRVKPQSAVRVQGGAFDVLGTLPSELSTGVRYHACIQLF
jgi:hypothetical protein